MATLNLKAEFGADTKALEAAIKRLEGKFDNLGKAGKKAGDKMGELSAKSKQSRRALKQFAAVAVTAAVAVGVQAVRAFAKFEEGMAEVGTLTKFTGRQMRGMGNETKKMARTFGQSLEVLTKARYDIVSAGFSDITEQTTLLNQANILAVAGVTDVSTATDLLTSVLNAYNLEASDAERVSDILFTTVKTGKTTIDQLNSALGKILPTAKGTGVSLEELTGAIATMTVAGIKTPEAVTALNAALFALKAPTSSAGKAFTELGINLVDTSGATLGLVDVISQFEGLPLDVIRKLIPSEEAAKAMLSLANNTELLEENIRQAGERASVTREAFKTMAQTSAFQFRQLSGTVEVLKTNFGEFLTTAAGGPSIMQSVTGVLEGWARLFEVDAAGASNLGKELTLLTAALTGATSEELAAISRGFDDAAAGLGTLQQAQNAIQVSIGVERARLNTRLIALNENLAKAEADSQDAIRDKIKQIQAEKVALNELSSAQIIDQAKAAAQKKIDIEVEAANKIKEKLIEAQGKLADAQLEADGTSEARAQVRADKAVEIEQRKVGKIEAELGRANNKIEAAEQVKNDAITAQGRNSTAETNAVVRNALQERLQMSTQEREQLIADKRASTAEVVELSQRATAEGKTNAEQRGDDFIKSNLLITESEGRTQRTIREGLTETQNTFIRDEIAKREAIEERIDAAIAAENELGGIQGSQMDSSSEASANALREQLAAMDELSTTSSEASAEMATASVTAAGESVAAWLTASGEMSDSFGDTITDMQSVAFVETDVTAPTRTAQISVDNFIKNNENRTITIRVRTQESKAEGGIVGFQGGGIAASDTVPAMLTPGEMVINQKQTAKNRGILQAINAGTGGFAEGGIVQGFQGGGVAQAIEAGQVAQRGQPDIKGTKKIGAEFLNIQRNFQSQMFSLRSEGLSELEQLETDRALARSRVMQIPFSDEQRDILLGLQEQTFDAQIQAITDSGITEAQLSINEEFLEMMDSFQQGVTDIQLEKMDEREQLFIERQEVLSNILQMPFSEEQKELMVENAHAFYDAKLGVIEERDAGEIADREAEILEDREAAIQQFYDRNLNALNRYFGAVIKGERAFGKVIGQLGVDIAMQAVDLIVNQKLAEIGVVKAAEIWKAIIESPGTFGGSLGKIPIIIAAGAAAKAALGQIRFHEGGIVGGSIDAPPRDVQIIAQAGERVLTRDETQAIEAGGAVGGGLPPINVTIEMDGIEVGRALARADIPRDAEFM